MENSSIDGNIEPAYTESNKYPMFLAIGAFVLSGLSLVFAWNTKSNLTRHKDTIIKEVNDAVEVAKQAAADARNGGVSGDGIATLKTDFEELQANVKAEYSKLKNSVEQLIAHAKKTEARLNAIGGGSAAPATAAPSSTASDTRAPATAAPASSGTYKVKKGDYPAKIAKDLGVSLKALLDANPGLDPKKLQIGQELKVPANQ